MSPIDAMMIESRCSRLIVSYANLLDQREFEAAGALWAENATLHGLTAVQEGREAIVASLVARPVSFSRHVISNIHIDVLDQETAEGVSYFTLYRSGTEPSKPLPHPLDGPATVGQYFDRFQMSQDGWRFASRRIVLNFIT